MEWSDGWVRYGMEGGIREEEFGLDWIWIFEVGKED